MKIEVGKFYKTRDGQRVGPMQDDWPDDAAFCWHTTSGSLTESLWDKFGKNYKGYDTDRDLIAEWTDTPEVGTLQEIGALVGDVVSDDGEGPQEVVAYCPDAEEPWTLKRVQTGHVDTWYGDSGFWRIISRAQSAGPVRTVTRKEIVQGTYGSIYVSDNNADGVRVTFPSSRLSVDELTAAIDTLTSIRDALKESGE